MSGLPCGCRVTCMQQMPLNSRTWGSWVSGLRFCYVLFSSPEHQQTDVSSVEERGFFINDRWAQEQKTRERAGKLPLNLARRFCLFSLEPIFSSSDLRPRIGSMENLQESPPMLKTLKCVISLELLLIDSIDSWNEHSMDLFCANICRKRCFSHQVTHTHSYTCYT